MKKRCRRLLVKLVVFLLVSVCLSCKSKPGEFEKGLEEVDLCAEFGTREKTLSKIKWLRSKATTPKEFLSLAKREYEFKAVENACDTLLKGIKKIDSVELAAFLTFLSIETKNYKIAAPYISALDGSPYSSLATEFRLINPELNNDLKLNYTFLMSAFDETKNEAFLVDAALAQAVTGNLKEALSLKDKMQDNKSAYPYFWALLAFDIGRFSKIFEELPNMINIYNLSGADNEKLALQTKAHVLLAADAAYGLGSIEMARAYWTMYADMFPEANPTVFYNLALTSAGAQSRAKALMECVQAFPSFYPATAQYVRDYVNYQKTAKENIDDKVFSEVESLLKKSGLYTKEMEDRFSEEQFFSLTPEELLTKRYEEFGNPKFALELLRFRLMNEGDFRKHTGQVWLVLERFPGEPKTIEFAKWYFSKMLDFETVLKLPEIGDVVADAFYTGCNSSLTAETSTALSSYKLAFGKLGFEYASRVNYACTKALLGKSNEAIEIYTEALNYTSDPARQSKIYFRIAEILLAQNQYEQAKNNLQQALKLDSTNYSAENLLLQVPLK